MWMFASNRLSLATGEKRYNDLAIELAQAIHPAFVHDRASSRPCIFWKMSTDLSQPLVQSEGNLDPMDGLVIYRLLQETHGANSTILASEIADYRKIVNFKFNGYNSCDPLDLVMTLWIAHWFGTGHAREEWAKSLLTAAESDLSSPFNNGYFDAEPRHRLAFREFGTCLGIKTAFAEKNWTARVGPVFRGWEDTKVVPDPDLWNEDGIQIGANAMDDLQPITMVMYASALNPRAFSKGFLTS